MPDLNQLNDRQFKNHSLIVSLFSVLLITTGFIWLDQRFEHLFQQTYMHDVYYVSREITNIGYASHYFTIALILFLITNFFHKQIPYFKKDQF